MTLSFARIVPKAALGDTDRVLGAEPVAANPPPARIVSRNVVEAADRARRIVAEAEARASALLERAKGELAELYDRTLAEARAEAVAALAAQRLAQQKSEAEADQRALARRTPAR